MIWRVTPRPIHVVKDEVYTLLCIVLLKSDLICYYFIGLKVENHVLVLLTSHLTKLGLGRLCLDEKEPVK